MLITKENFKNDKKLAYYGNARRPYYILRGKKISKEQAFDIIANECNLLSLFNNYNNNEEESNEHIYRNTLANILKTPHTDWITTFVDPMGNVGENDIASKWPEEYEFIKEHLYYAKKYPYLSYVVIYTDFDESDWEWPVDIIKPFNFMGLGKIKNQYKYSLHIHDGGVEVVDKDEAFRLYDKYMEEYSSDEIFCRDDYNNYVKPYLDEDYIDKLSDRWNVSYELREEIKSYNNINVKKKIKEYYNIYNNFVFEEYKKKVYEIIFDMMNQVVKAVENNDLDLKSVKFKENQEKCYKLLKEEA